MNKQEFIETLESLERDSFNENYNEGYDQAVRDCLAVAKATVSHFVCGNDITSSDLVYFLSCSFILGLGLYLGGSSV